ncbi:MAG: major capsid protein [Deltaproteobacteria bacterium]|nr:major capsid protein [Deltaproteobacteria bacterium]
MFNLAKDPAFNLASLTAAINILPNNYGRLEQMGLFPVKGVKTRAIYVEEKNGVLTLLQTQPVGSPGTAGKSGKRKLRSFVVPHIPHDDIVLASDVDGVRSFGTEDTLQTVTNEMNDKLQAMKNKHAITLEHLRMGALKGIILDADGSELYNLYTEFDITAKTIDFKLGTAATDVRGKCLEVARHIEDNLLGEVSTGVRCLVSPEFFDAFTKHAKVEKAFTYFENQNQDLSKDLRGGFKFGGITFEEYRGVASDAEGTARRFIADGEGHAYPEGTMDTFKTAAAAADFNETVNTMGLLYYAKVAERKHRRGYDLHTQSNPLPLCQRPGVLVKVHSSN